MRLFALAGIMSLMTLPAFALDAATWQKQLQGEMTRLQQHSPMLQTDGQVKVIEQGTNYVATLPAMTIMAADQSRWQIPSISMIAPANAKASAKVSIQLPETISYKEITGFEHSKITIGQQNISGTWNFSKNYFENLTGDLRNINFLDNSIAAQTTVNHITIAAATAAVAQITALDIKTVATKPEVPTKASIAKASVGYQFTGTPQLTITRMIGLLNPVWLVAENQPFTISASSSQLSFTDDKANTTMLESLATKMQVQPKQNGDVLTAQSSFEAKNMKQSPETAYGFILPQHLRLTGVISNLPVQMLAFGPQQNWTIAKQVMAKLGTQADFSDITWETYHQSNLKGTGTLKAASGTPLGMTGHVILNLENLQGLITTLQQQLAQPSGDMKVKSQGLMMLMMLQGLGKQNSNVTQFIIDFTPEGQILVNGNNMTGLVPGQGGGAAGALQGLQGLQGLMNQKPAVSQSGI